MANHAAIPTATTLAAALDAVSNTVYLTSASGMAVGYGNRLVIGNEFLVITEVNTTTGVAQVRRGQDGTMAQAHPSGAIVYYGTPATFRRDPFTGEIGLEGYNGALGVPVLPLGKEYVDPHTGYVYVLCNAGAAHVVGEVIVFDADFLTASMAATSKGRVGIVVEAPGSSDRAFWVLVKGSYSATMMTSDVTTAMILGAGTGSFAPYSSDNAVKVNNATCTTAPSTATSPTYGGGLGTVYLNNAWVNGVDEFVS